MALQVSPAFQAAFAHFFKQQFDGGEIRVFSGTQPATSGLAESGTLLGKVRRDDGGALVLTASGPYVIKDVLATWVLTTVAAGTATWFRYVADPADAGEASNSALRFDGAISDDSVSGAEMIMENPALLDAHTYSIDQFIYTIPPIIGG